MPIALHFFKHKYESKKQNSRDKLQEEIHFNTLINNKLDSIKEDFEADRVWVCQFHNGGNFYPTGKSIQKFSMFYESVSPNTDSIKMQFQNIPVSLFAKSTVELLENDVISIPDYKNKNINTFGLDNIADNTGARSGYLAAIKTLDNKFIGILGVDYSRKTELDEYDLNELLVEASSMGGVLMNHLIK